MSPFDVAVKSYLAHRAGIVTAALYDLKTGRTWSLDPQAAPQASASIVKVDILEALLDEAALSGKGLSNDEERLIPAMIEVSSNDAATSLWVLAGGGAGITRYNHLLGMSHTTASSCVMSPNARCPGWGLTRTTPADQVLLLKQLVLLSAFVTPSAQQYALGLLTDIAPSLRWGVSAGVAPGTIVAMKTGDLPLNDAGTDWQVNSIGWVDGGGHDYVLAMLSTGNPSLEYGIETLNEISSLMWASWNGS